MTTLKASPSISLRNLPQKGNVLESVQGPLIQNRAISVVTIWDPHVDLLAAVKPSHLAEENVEVCLEYAILTWRKTMYFKLCLPGTVSHQYSRHEGPVGP